MEKMYLVSVDEYFEFKREERELERKKAAFKRERVELALRFVGLAVALISILAGVFAACSIMYNSAAMGANWSESMLHASLTLALVVTVGTLLSYGIAKQGMGRTQYQNEEEDEDMEYVDIDA